MLTTNKTNNDSPPKQMLIDCVKNRHSNLSQYDKGKLQVKSIPIDNESMPKDINN